MQRRFLCYISPAVCSSVYFLLTLMRKKSVFLLIKLEPIECTISDSMGIGDLSRSPLADPYIACSLLLLCGVYFGRQAHETFFSLKLVQSTKNWRSPNHSELSCNLSKTGGIYHSKALKIILQGHDEYAFLSNWALSTKCWRASLMDSRLQLHWGNCQQQSNKIG